MDIRFHPSGLPFPSKHLCICLLYLPGLKTHVGNYKNNDGSIRSQLKNVLKYISGESEVVALPFDDLDDLGGMNLGQKIRALFDAMNVSWSCTAQKHISCAQCGGNTEWEGTHDIINAGIFIDGQQYDSFDCGTCPQCGTKLRATSTIIGELPRVLVMSYPLEMSRSYFYLDDMYLESEAEGASLYKHVATIANDSGGDFAQSFDFLKDSWFMFRGDQVLESRELKPMTFSNYCFTFHVKCGHYSSQASVLR